jgi:hypothetical protein
MINETLIGYKRYLPYDEYNTSEHIIDDEHTSTYGTNGMINRFEEMFKSIEWVLWGQNV